MPMYAESVKRLDDLKLYSTSNDTAAKREAEKELEQLDLKSQENYKLTFEAKLKKTGIELKSYETSKNYLSEILWTVTNVLFVIGGMIGAFGSKFLLDKLGRRNSIVFQYLFSGVGAVLVFIAPLINSPECVMASRFLYGAQGGLCYFYPNA